MQTLKTVVQSARPKFLLLAPICVALGATFAHSQGHVVDLLTLFLCLGISILAHASVNLFNEYCDAKSGLDDTTVKTPFSGGSGALQDNPEAVKAVLWAGVIASAVFCIMGLILVFDVKWQLVLFGLVGLAVIVAYTPWLNRTSWLCLISPGTGFGLLFVLGTYAAFSNHLTIEDALITLPVFFLVNNLLLLNQFPDAKADKKSGRKHFVIKYGYEKSAMVYLFSGVLAFASILVMVFFNTLPYLSLIALILLPVSIMIGIKARQFQHSALETFLPLMGLNVVVTLLTPAILAVSLLLV